MIWDVFELCRINVTFLLLVVDTSGTPNKGDFGTHSVKLPRNQHNIFTHIKTITMTKRIII